MMAMDAEGKSSSDACTISMLAYEMHGRQVLIIAAASTTNKKI
jgi:hypothetical protein